ncbi:573_t:CDS:2 [Cetraspora pellucida]|uniref:573_t:CDS:1 n=1 Tax=Cetraspora pellucida TaxID=1433469 RepID=A0A9N9AH83_9GLOM|nr:573_t:CDS:2 [Cetraspora pellucida]
MNALSVKTILHNHQFWQDVEKLEIILASAKRAINAVETKSSNIALCQHVRVFFILNWIIEKKELEDNNNEDENKNKNKNSFDINNETEESNFDNLLIAEIIDLNSYNINEIENTLSLNDNIKQESESEKNSDIDFESIYNKKFY